MQIAMDGSRRYTEFPDTLYSQVLMNAYWENDTTLHVISRWVETCSRQERIFRFFDNQAEIETTGNMFLGIKEDVVTAFREG